MKLQRTYTQSAAEQKKAASTGFAAVISQLGEELFKVAGEIGSKTILAANITTKMGLELSAWLNREQMRFEQFEGFFRQHAKELPTWLDSSAARKLISAHKAYPDEITDLATAVAVLNQMTFFAVGLMEEPKRLLTQTASGNSPMAKLMVIWGREREALQKFRSEIPEEKWTEEIWFTVRSQTREAAELNAKAEEQLRKAK